MTPWTIVGQAPLSVGILQAKMLEWVAIAPPPGDLPNPRDQTQVSRIVGGFLSEPPGYNPIKGALLAFSEKGLWVFPPIEVLLLIRGDFIHQIS